MNNPFKVSGIALTAYGAFEIIVFLYSYYGSATPINSIAKLPISMLLLICLLLAVNLLAFLCGIYLLNRNEAVHKIALPVSVVLLLSLPFGTIVGGIYLVQRYKVLKR
ncbi:MAG: hypothetical protein ACPG46_03410 [Thalassotalea sp.]